MFKPSTEARYNQAQAKILSHVTIHILRLSRSKTVIERKHLKTCDRLNN